MPSKKRRETRSPSGICPVAYQFYAQCSLVFAISTKRSHCFSFLWPGVFSFRSGLAFFCNFSGEISRKICRVGFIRCRSSKLMRSCPVVRFWWLLLFLRFVEKHKIHARSFRSTRLVSRNKSGGHATVRSWWLILFWRFAEKQNPRYIVLI